MLTHWSLDQIGTIFQTFSNAFSSKKIFEFWKQLHWKMGPEGPSNWQQSVMVQAHGLVVLCYVVVLDKHVYGGPYINMFIQSHNITQRNQTMCIIHGIYCVFWLGPLGDRLTHISFHHIPNLMKIFFCSHPISNKVIATKFCICHDSTAAVACAKICCDLMASNWITAM